MSTRRLRFVLAFVPLALLAGCADRVVSVPDPRAAATPAEVVAQAAAPEKAPAEAPAQGKAAAAKGWPMFGGTPARNMVGAEKNILGDFSVDPAAPKNVKWSAALGNHSYGGPVIAGGKIFVGTNNEQPRDPKVKGDKGVLMCFDEATGKFLWQLVFDKLDNPEENDWPKQGIVSTPVVEGDRLYFVNNRCELVCASTDGKVVWTLDMIKKLGVYPTYVATASPLVVGDLVYVNTSNGVDLSNHVVKNPKAPSFLAVNKKTGEVAWQYSLGKDILEGQWANPAAAEVKGKWQVFFPGGDGWMYAFDAAKGDLLWKFDCNPKKAVFKPTGRGDKNYFVSTPVVHDNKLYIGVGLNPEDGPGAGHFWCIDVTKEPANKDKDVSPVGDNFDPKAEANKGSALVWHYGGAIVPRPAKGRDYRFGRTISTAAVADGLVYVSELDGFLHCFDAATGQKHWELDLDSGTWCSPYVVDGKVFVGNEACDLFVVPHGKALQPAKKIPLDLPVQLPPVAANGVLYVNNGRTLYAIGK